MSSIYLLELDPKYKKMWLTGTTNFKKCQEYLNLELTHLNLKIDDSTNVVVKYTKTFKEYDEYLKNNIVFVDLFDAAANNTVLECIIRHTPIIINKIEGVVDYLGEDYPLYFNDISEVNSLLTYENIFNAHFYLKNLKTMDVNTFCIKLINLFH